MTRPTALFVSGCPGDTRRYRVHHQAEALRLAGWQVDVRLTEHSWDIRRLSDPLIMILHRARWDEDLAELLAYVRERGATVVFDTDDLVFLPERQEDIAAQLNWPAAKRTEFAQSVAGYRETLLQCSGCLTPTVYLSSQVQSLGLPAEVARNAIDLELLRLSSRALRSARDAEDKVAIGYASGTPTHDRDFALVAPHLRGLMESAPRIELRIFGYLSLGDEWESLEAQVRHVDFMPWQALPQALARLDINLAPLPIGESFSESKSEIKYVEAGAVAVPTIASATGAFRHAIRNRETGLLAHSEGEWRSALVELVQDQELRRTLGRAARADVVDRYVSDVRSTELVDAVLALIRGTGGSVRAQEPPRRPREPLSVLTPPERSQDPAWQSAREAVISELEARGVPVDRVETSDAGEARSSSVVFLADYEPFLEPMGPERLRASLALKDGSPVVGLGPWLAEWLRVRHGVPVRALGYPVDPRIHYPGHRDAAQEQTVVYDARSLSRAGGDDLGIRALSLLRELIPEVRVILHDVPASGWRPDWEHSDAGEPDPAARAALYRSAGAILAPVFTNVPLQVVEALACGCPVVAVDTSPCRWLLRDGVTAALGAPTGEALCGELVRVLTSADYRSRLISGGLAAVERFSRHRLVDDLLGPPPKRTDYGWVRGDLLLDRLQWLADPEGVKLTPGRRVGQTFFCRFDGLCRVDFQLRLPTRPAGAVIKMRLLTHPPAGDELAAAEVDLADALGDLWTRFEFDPIPDSAGRRFYVALECSAACSETDSAPEVATCRSDVFAAGRTYVNGSASPQTLAFRTFCRPRIREAELCPVEPEPQSAEALLLLELGMEVRALQEELRRDHATLPYRALAAAAAASRRLGRLVRVGSAIDRRE